MKRIIAPFLLIVLLLVTGALTLSSCKGNKSKSDKTTAEDTTRTAVETAVVERQLVHNRELFSATVEPKTSNNIVPQAGGRIKSIHVEVGSFVSKGQVLVVMDNSQLDQARVQLADARLAFSRMDELYKVGGVSQAQWEARRSALTMAETTFANIQENTMLRSPINGVVTARNYDSGDMCSPSMPIFVVQEINPVKLKVNVSERYYSVVSKGMPAQLTIDALGGETFEGKVSLIYPTLNAATHTFAVEVEVPNKNNTIRPGMYGRVTLDFGDREALLVLDRAVVKQSGSGEYYVYKINGDRAERVNVTIGAKYDTMLEILEGLEAGTTVVTEGAQILRNGARVKVLNK